MTPDDPGLWKIVSGWLWAALLIPVAILWKKIEGAIQKDDFTRYAQELRDVIKEHASNDEKIQERTRETLIDIFKRLDEHGQGIARIETALTFMQKK